jgi:hypothetical protein
MGPTHAPVDLSGAPAQLHLSDITSVVCLLRSDMASTDDDILAVVGLLSAIN